MKILATIRFSLIAFILYGTTITIVKKRHSWTILNWDTVFNIVMDTLVLFYIYYLIREALSEWKNRTSPNPRAFQIYGLGFEIILFFGGVWVLTDTAWKDVKIWSGLILILVVLGILILVITDSIKLKKLCAIRQDI
jgi:hypothetical protein